MYRLGGTFVANTELDEQFVAQQKERLEGLREQLLQVRGEMEGDIESRGEQDGDFTEHDSGDMSRDLFDREMDATIEQQAEQRLGVVDRALEKIEEGTYGLSDESGEPIPRGRLEALPEAIRTVDEQQEYERERRPPV